MSFMTEEERQAALKDFSELLKSSGETSILHKLDMLAGGGFAGTPAPSYTAISTPLPTIARDQRAADNLQKDHDFVLLVQAEGVGVDEGDLLEFRGAKCLVVDIREVNLFGVVTHLEVAVKQPRA